MTPGVQHARNLGDMSDATTPPLVTFPLSQGEAQTLNECWGTDKWTPGQQHQWTASDRRRLEEEAAKQAQNARWPGTKLFDHNAAYRVEMLNRIANRIPL